MARKLSDAQRIAKGGKSRERARKLIDQEFRKNVRQASSGKEVRAAQNKLRQRLNTLELGGQDKILKDLQSEVPRQVSKTKPKQTKAPGFLGSKKKNKK